MQNFAPFQEAVVNPTFRNGASPIIKIGVTNTFGLCLVGYPSLLTPKTAPPCPSKDLRGPAPGHPGVL